MVLGLFGVCFSIYGQRIQDGNSFAALDSSSSYRPPLSLADGTAFPFSNNFAWMTAPADFLPTWRPDGWGDRPLNFANVGTADRRRASMSGARSYSTDTSKESVELRKSLWENVHGEVGFLYGRSSGGRFSRDVEAGYIFGEVGDDRFHVIVGASYENSNYDFSRRGR